MPAFTMGLRKPDRVSTATMRALVFRGPNQIAIEQVPIPKPGPGEALIRVTLTTICGTDLHILKGEYPVRPGLVIGHEPVGVIRELGIGVTGYSVGERSRRVASAISASAATLRNAEGRSAGGNSGTRSMGLRPNICWSQALKQTSQKSPMNFRMNRSCCSRTLHPREFPPPKAQIYKSVTRQRCSRKAPSACARRREQN